MSFFTSFWDLPQKEQERFPCSSRFFSPRSALSKSVAQGRGSVRADVADGEAAYLPGIFCTSTSSMSPYSFDSMALMK